MEISLFVCKSTNERTIIINMFKLLGCYMFRHHCVVIRELALPNYISAVAALVNNFNIFIIIMLSLVDLQIIKSVRYMY